MDISFMVFVAVGCLLSVSKLYISHSNLQRTWGINSPLYAFDILSVDLAIPPSNGQCTFFLFISAIPYLRYAKARLMVYTNGPVMY